MTTINKKIWKVNWTKNITSKGGAQAEVLDAMGTSDEIPLCSISRKEGRLWASVDRDAYLALVAVNHGIYEIIRPDKKRKIYFDVDMKGDALCDLETIKNKILEKFPDALFAISGSITEVKTSYHIVLLNYHFCNQEDQHRMMRWINTLTCLGVDNLVYTKNRLMKCVNQSKPDGRVQEDMSGHSIEDHTICFVKDTSQDAGLLPWAEDDEARDVAAGRAPSRVDILNLPQLNLPNPVDFDWFEALPLDILNIIPCELDHNTNWKVMLWAKENKISFEDFWNWLRQSDADIERLSKYNHYWMRGGHSPGIFFIKTVLERFYPHITRDRSTEKFLKSFEIENERVSEGQWLSKSDLALKEKFVLLTGIMGSNKTGSVIDKLDPKKKILWLTPRRTLTHNTLERIAQSKKGFDFKNYMDYAGKKQKEIQTFQHLSCCLPSLWLTGSQIYDTVIIDEIETMNMMWQGGLKNPGANKININFPRFKDIIRGASKVYVMDAFMCARTVNLLKEIDPVAKVVAIKNPEPAPKRTFVSVPDKNTWIAEICSQLKDGKNLFVFYPYKNSSKNHISMEQLAKTLSCGSGLDISDFIFYNADQSDEIKKTTRNVNAVWTQKRCIITNTSITVGVNFDSLYFDTVFAWNVNWVSARDFFQVLYRCRTIKTNNVYLFQQGGGSLNPWIHSDLQDPIYRNLLTGLKYEFNSCGSKEVFNYFSFRANIHFGGKISEASKQVKTEIDEIITKSECLFRWDKIEDIGYDKYEVALHQIINSFTTSIDTGLQVRKYIFKQLFHNSTPETTLADIWNQHRFRAVDGVHALIALGEVDSSETKIVKSIFGNSENLELPKHVKWDYDIQAVRECFETRVVGEQAKYNSQLISNILKAYFGMSVFVSTKERSHIEGQHGNQLTDYKMTEQFLTIKNELLKWIDRGEEKHELREFSFTDDY